MVESENDEIEDIFSNTLAKQENKNFEILKSTLHQNNEGADRYSKKGVEAATFYDNQREESKSPDEDQDGVDEDDEDERAIKEQLKRQKLKALEYLVGET